MAKPNYQFEKKQRELAKQKKKEEKARKKGIQPATGEGREGGPPPSGGERAG
jgi:hypothetical protein